MKREEPLPLRRSAFDYSISPRGDQGAVVYVDTGVLLAAGARIACIDAFTQHFGGRLRVVGTVISELRHQSKDLNVDGLVRSAASTVLVRAVDNGRIEVDPANDIDPILFDTVKSQLAALPGSSDDDHPLKNAGEALTIATCVRRKLDGQNVVILANDGGASLVASRHGLRTRHFCQVLQELVCAGRVDAAAAYELFAIGHKISGVPIEVVPVDASALACVAVDGICKICPALADSTSYE